MGVPTQQGSMGGSGAIGIGTGKGGDMDLLSSGQRVQRFRTGIRMMIAVALVVVVGVARLSQVAAQGSSPAERLKQEKSGKNIYRGGVPDAFAAKANMEELFDKILISGPGDGKADEWYEPHLRDQMIDQVNRKLESEKVRGDTRPKWNVGYECLEKGPPIPKGYTACPLGRCGEPHVWHGEPFKEHRPESACWGAPTTPYKQLLQDQNFKACCVRQEHKTWTSEQIAAKHPNGDGWAGIFEVFYPWGALGWENDRTTSMIVEKSTIDQCVKIADQFMEDSDAREWVRDGIMRNYKTAKGSSPSQAEVDAVIKDVITKVRPTDKELRFADNLDGEGITVRLNLATLVREYRQKLAARVCGWPNQFDKLLVPGQDPFQFEGSGGLDLQSLAGSKIFSNYCPEGVDLMLAAREGPGQRIQNTDSTPTDLAKGYAAWKRDPVYCQAKNIANASLRQSGIADVIQKIGAGGGLLVDDGGSCLPGANLNYSMVPVFYRTSRVERRTDIGGRIMGALIAASLAPGMINGKKSVMKHFEWQPYTIGRRGEKYQTFVGLPFKGGGTNELKQPCPQLSGSGLQYKNKSDRLYISNVTHQPFTQEIIDESNNIDKYAQDWAVAWRKQQIANRGLDKMSQNYAAVFRPMAVCPSGMTRWEPPEDEHNHGLRENLRSFCREEYFGVQP